MGDEIELVSDGEGLAVIGSSSAVERFLASVGLGGEGSQNRSRLLSAGSAVAQAGSEIAANSGRWLKLTEESAKKVKDLGLMPTKNKGVSHAMIGRPGKVDSWVQVVKTPGSMLSNPAALAGVAGVMAQLAMQQQMDEIKDYLAAIDKKLDAVLRAQTNQVLARLDGIALAVREAMTVRASVGRVSEVTWSKVQSSTQAIHETQAYALRQLADLADELEEQTKIADLLDTAEKVKADVKTWLVALARCFELHDAVAVLELDRVMDASPEELDRHRLGLRSARDDQLELISERTQLLLRRMEAAVDRANSKVLFNPKQSPAVVASSNEVAAGVLEFRQLLGIESAHDASEARRWREAASERLEQARRAGSSGIDAAKDLGGDTVHQARSIRNKLSSRLADRKSRRADEEEPLDEE